MKVIGIIAEYNPFHNGHAYQLETLKKEIGADHAIVAMSGNFVQRGAPALLEKYSRAQAALNCGADLVLELPALYATSSAEYFAKGGVSLLKNTGVVTHLCFGTENSPYGILLAAAETLLRQPAAFREALKAELKKGRSFPAARLAALRSYFSANGSPAAGPLADLLADALSSPNNILAVEYLKAVFRDAPGLIPFPLARKGGGHRSASLEGGYGPASAIRARLKEEGFLAPLGAGGAAAPGMGEAAAPGTGGATAPGMDGAAALNAGGATTPGADEANPGAGEAAAPGMGGAAAQKRKLPCEVAASLPAPSRALLEDYPHPLLSEDDLSLPLHYKLAFSSCEELASYADSSPALAARIKKELPSFSSWTSFCSRLHTKDVTYARISRLFLHILLSVRQEDLDALGAPSYLRVLGFRKDAAALLSAVKSHGSLPLVTSPADAQKALPEPGKRLLQLDLDASELYRVGLADKGRGCRLKNDFQHPIVRI